MIHLLATSLVWGGFKWHGSFTTLDLIAASTNSLSGAMLARRPDHYKQFTVVGIILMALLGGLGGGITRDVMVAQVPAALTNPAYITLALVFAFLGYFLACGEVQLFREGLFQLITAFSLPWYAIVGAQKGVLVGLPVWGSVPRSREFDSRPLLHRHHLRDDREAVHSQRVVHRGPRC